MCISKTKLGFDFDPKKNIRYGSDFPIFNHCSSCGDAAIYLMLRRPGGQTKREITEMIHYVLEIMATKQKEGREPKNVNLLIQ